MMETEGTDSPGGRHPSQICVSISDSIDWTVYHCLQTKDSTETTCYVTVVSKTMFML